MCIRSTHFNAPQSGTQNVSVHYNAPSESIPISLDTAEQTRVDVKEMTLEERKAYIQAVAEEVAQGKSSLGGATKQLRENLLGINQERFAVACKISKRTLSQLEVDSGNPTLATLDAVFRKFGLKISLAHLSPLELNAAASRKSKAGFSIPTVTAALPPSPISKGTD